METALVRFNGWFEVCAVRVILLGSALILFIPLITTRETLFFYIFGKMLVFQIAVEVLFAIWLCLAVIKKKYRPPLGHPLVIALFTFIGIVVVTSFFAEDRVRAWWSIQERSTGVIALLHCAAWFLVLVSTIKSWAHWRFLLRVGLFASVIVGIYGIGQRFGVNLLLPDLSTVRLASTLGNPIYLGVYTMLFIGVAAILLTREKNNLWRLFYACTIPFNLFIMLQSATRGVTLALIVVTFAFAVFAALLVQDVRWRRRIRVSLTVILASIMLALGLLYTPIGKLWAADHLPSWFAERLLYHAFDDTGRQTLWTIGVKGFLERPFTGWGWENFNYVNDRFIHSTRFIVTNPWTDRSHNQIIDVFVMTGFFGGISYLALWAILMINFFKKIRLQSTFQSKLPLLVAVLLFAAYFLQNLTVFDTPAPLIVFYFLLGFAYFLVTEKPEFQILSGRAGYERKLQRTEERVDMRRPFPLLGFPLLAGATFVSAFLMWNINIIHYNASKQGIRLLFSLGNPLNIDGALAGFREYFTTSSFTKYEFREQLSDAYASVASSPFVLQEKKQKLLAFIIGEIEKTMHEKPNDFRPMMRLFLLYRAIPNGGEEANDKARAVMETARAKFPWRYEIFRNLAEVSFVRGNTAEGLAYAQQAAEMDSRRARSLWFLAIAYAQNGENNKALDSAWQAMANDDHVGSYGEDIALLAQSLRSPVAEDLLEYFATLAAAYGADDQRFIFARNRVFALAQAEKAASNLAKSEN